jgi:CRP-like cAMP-binding protein
LPTALKRLPSSNRPPPANNLLSALPAEVYDRLAPTLGTTPLKLKRFLHKPGERIDQVYFPGGGFASVVTVLKDGSMVEVATIGREGMLGLPAVLAGDLSPAATMVQAETDVCYTMSPKAFRQEMDRRGAFYELLTRYGQALVGFIMQSTACNAVHSVEQRLSRWLLLVPESTRRTPGPCRRRAPGSARRLPLCRHPTWQSFVGQRANHIL